LSPRGSTCREIRVAIFEEGSVDAGALVGVNGEMEHGTAFDQPEER
jgi:hypothetical protein